MITGPLDSGPQAHNAANNTNQKARHRQAESGPRRDIRWAKAVSGVVLATIRLLSGNNVIAETGLILAIRAVRIDEWLSGPVGDVRILAAPEIHGQPLQFRSDQSCKTAFVRRVLTSAGLESFKGKFDSVDILLRFLNSVVPIQLSTEQWYTDYGEQGQQ